MDATAFHSVIVVLRKETAFPLWRATPMRWNKRAVSLAFSVTVVTQYYYYYYYYYYLFLLLYLNIRFVSNILYSGCESGRGNDHHHHHHLYIYSAPITRCT